MMPRTPVREGGSPRRAFSAHAFLESTVGRSIRRYRRAETIFTQGDACEDVMYIRSGGVRLSVKSKAGREVLSGTLGPGEFFGEGCLAGQPMRTGSATAITPSTILLVGKARMGRLLHRQHAMSDRFIAHVLSRNIQIEEDLIDQFCSSCEKRLARALLLLVRYGKRDRPSRVTSKVSLETLADMIGTTRPRVQFFLAKFKQRGFIEYDGDDGLPPLRINSSLLNVVLRD